MFGKNFLFVLIASIYFIIVQCSSDKGDPQQDSEIIDTDEIFDLKYMKSSFKGNHTGWKYFKENVIKFRNEAAEEYIQKHALSYFQCAIIAMKNMLEFHEKDYKKVAEDFLGNENLQAIYGSFSVPKEIADIHSTRDRDTLIHINSLKFRTSNKPGSIDELTKYFRMWFYLFENPQNGCVTLKKLKARLKSYYNHTKEERKFKNLVEVYLLFSAHISRSFIMARTLFHHVFSEKIVRAIRPDETRGFPEILITDIFPSWYFSKEQCIFLNILRSAQKKLPRNDRINGWLIQNDYGDSVYAPYLVSNECGRWPSTTDEPVTGPAPWYSDYVEPQILSL